MQLILMRHGLAVERDEWKSDDSSRPLTPEGREKTALAARGLASFCALPDLIASSPKTRALQTAELASAAWPDKSPTEIWPELAEENLTSWLTKLRGANANAVLLVGHEPDLSRFASWLLCGSEDTVEIVCKKAGVLSLDLDLTTQRAILLWMLPPRALRLLAK